MKNNSIINIFFALFLFSPILVAQSQNSVIAKVGEIEITAEEFKHRFDFMPHQEFTTDKYDSLKNNFLYSLIAEKLWYQESISSGYDTLEDVILSIQSLKKLFIKDELYRKEVESKIEISNEEVINGLEKINRHYKIHLLSAVDSSEIFSLDEEMKNGKKFDSLLASRKENELQLNPVPISFGSLDDEQLENRIFTLNKNDITPPIKTKTGWFIIKVVDVFNVPAPNPDSYELKNKTINIIKERKAKQLGEQYLNKILGGSTVTADVKLFKLFTDTLFKVLQMDSSFCYPDTSYKRLLMQEHVQKTLKLIPPKYLNEKFILFESNPLPLKEFIFYLLYQKVEFENAEFASVKKNINSVIRQFIQDEILVREAIREGLDNMPSVGSDLQRWKENYLAQLKMSSFIDSIKITNEEVKEYYLSKFTIEDSLELVDIIEIFMRDLNVVEKVLDELKNGEPFESLAKVFNERVSTKETGGHFGYFSVTASDEIGRVVRNMNIGEILGPIKLQDGYSVIKLIDRKTVKSNLEDDFEKYKSYYKMQAALNKLDNLLNDKTISLARKYGISINQNVFDSTDVLSINTFTYRLIGFGGKIAAIPITTPLFEWFYNIHKDKVLP